MTREEAIAYFKRHIDLYCVEGVCREAEELAIKALEQQQKWIPISERLPEENKRVLVSDVMGIYIGEFVDAEENWGGKHFINEHGMHSKSVKAWMPLPKPYKAESEDKCKKCKYYRNPDYTRCHTCKAESEVQDADSD